MAKAGGKGKVSNDLVAASCAAVLAVYSAGYWRTRDAARRIDIQAQERRPARPPRPAAATVAAPAAIAVVAPMPQATLKGALPAISAPVVVATTRAATSAVEPPTGATAVVAPPPPVATQTTAAATAATSAAAMPAAAQFEPERSVVAAPALAAAAPAVPSGNWRDGTYTGWGTSRHGDIKAQVVIRNGRIVESSIASCETRYPCDVISEIFNQPVERQSPDVDRVSRATESADAYYQALATALDDALVQPAGQTTTR